MAAVNTTAACYAPLKRRGPYVTLSNFWVLMHVLSVLCLLCVLCPQQSPCPRLLYSCKLTASRVVLNFSSAGV